jgi:hypothetical protein
MDKDIEESPVNEDEKQAPQRSCTLELPAASMPAAAQYTLQFS